MAKTRDLETILAELKAIRDHPTSDASIKRLRAIIKKGVCHAASRAAEIIRDFELHQLTDDLIAAYPRFQDQPLKRDKGCFAKTRIIDALAQMGIDAEEIYREGIRYRQMEPAWGKPVDAAIELRGLCAMGLVRIGCPDAVLAITELLNDKEGVARADAARALGYSCDERAIPLLRFKTMIGDEIPQVITECLSGLLRLNPEAGLPFTRKFLEDPTSARQEAAALALGESRLPEAFGYLKNAYESAEKGTPGSTLLIAIGMLRRDEGIAYLISIVKGGAIREAKDALKALRIYQYDEAIRKRIEAAVKKQHHPELLRILKEG